jgi:peptide/nickel transport system permease protein
VLDYVVAARACGVRAWRVVFGHVIPNIMPPLLTYALFTVGLAMAAEAALSYLGLGVQIPQPSWGNIIASGQDNLAGSPQLVVLPSVALFLTVLSLNLTADALRRSLAVNR